MRIDKLLSNLKYGSRKEVTTLIKKGHLVINNNIIKDSSYKVDLETDDIQFMDQKVYYNDSVLLMLHKPKGYVSANHDALHKTVFELLKEPYTRFDLNIAGRLDIDTEGLLLLTNNGTILHNIISPSKNVYKKYYVEVENGFDFNRLTQPMEILDGNNNPFTPATPIVEKINEQSFFLSIKEGKFHQVKRMVAYHKDTVTYLKRVAIGDLELNDLKIGEYIEIEKGLFE